LAYFAECSQLLSRGKGDPAGEKHGKTPALTGLAHGLLISAQVPLVGRGKDEEEVMTRGKLAALVAGMILIISGQTLVSQAQPGAAQAAEQGIA
jgi:hypothetical protein